MHNYLKWVGIALFFLMGCSDNSGLSRDGAASDLTHLDALADLAIPVDFSMGDLTASLNLGHDCPTGNECPMGQICLSAKLDKSLPPGGFCTKPCANDSDCGGNAFCGPSLPGVGSLCFANCEANQTCAAQNRVCSRRLNGTTDLVKTACIPGNPTARDGTACSTFGDCNKNQLCQNNPFEAPGGICITIACTPGDDTTCSPAQGNTGMCLVANGFSLCIAGCKMDSDCRTIDKYSCVDLSGKGKGPNVCIFVHPNPGAACAFDAQCAAANSPWRCLMGAKFPGGYCSGSLGGCDPKDALSCPDHSACYDPTPNMPKSGDEYCTAGCTADGDCRMGQGYRCLPVNAMAQGCRLP